MANSIFVAYISFLKKKVAFLCCGSLPKPRPKAGRGGQRWEHSPGLAHDGQEHDSLPPVSSQNLYWRDKN